MVLFVYEIFYNNVVNGRLVVCRNIKYIDLFININFIYKFRLIFGLIGVIYFEFNFLFFFYFWSFCELFWELCNMVFLNWVNYVIKDIGYV